jgi:HAD superfamily hydrolase (TIGR01490 family)
VWSGFVGSGEIPASKTITIMIVEAAFFDLDKTVIARSSTLAMGKPMMREGLISRSDALRSLYAQLVYRLQGADDQRMERMRVALQELSKGWNQADVQRLIDETLVDLLEPTIHPEALELIREHRSAGRRVYIVSSSGIEVVRAFANSIGVPHVIATRGEIDDNGCYTGELTFYCYGTGKQVAMREEAARIGIDLSKSHAYSDSITDLPMLETVGFPNVVNPDKDLRAVASERGWPILEWKNPVSLRSKLPPLPPSPPPAAAIAAGAGAAAAMAFAWALRRRR